MDCIDLQSVPTRTVPKTRVRRGTNESNSANPPAPLTKQQILQDQEGKMEQKSNDKKKEKSEDDNSNPGSLNARQGELKDSSDNNSSDIEISTEKTNFDDHTFSYGELMGIIQYLTMYWQKMKPHLIKMDNNLGVCFVVVFKFCPLIFYNFI